VKRWYPKTIYQTPDRWGEVFWLGRRELNRSIASLRRLLQHDQPPSIEECTRWEHVVGGFYRKAGVRKEDQEILYFLCDRESRSWIPRRLQETSPIYYVDPEDSRRRED
jgi:hypothetical protein